MLCANPPLKELVSRYKYYKYEVFLNIVKVRDSCIPWKTKKEKMLVCLSDETWPLIPSFSVDQKLAKSVPF